MPVASIGEVALAENMTRPTGEDVARVLACVEPARRRADAERLDALFRDATGFRPEVWTGGILGYGRYRYTYASGHAGEFLATGFAPRKANLVAYIMPGYAGFGEILAELGPHKRGKACLYLTRLDRIDAAALTRLIRAGLDDLARRWPVTPT